MNKDIKVGLAWAGVLLLSAAGAVALRDLGYIGEDTVHRVIGLNGLMIAYYGNLAPKKVAPSACARQISRVGGWSLFLSGLAYAILWTFAPIETAATWGTGAVALGVAFTLGYCFWLRGRPDRSLTPS